MRIPRQPPEEAIRVLHIGKYFAPYAGGMENFLRDLLKAFDSGEVSASALVHHHKAGRPSALERHEDAVIVRVAVIGRLLYTPISPSFPIQLNRTMKRFRPQILHFHFPNPSGFFGLFLSTARRIPWVIHWHSDVVPSEIDSRLRLAYRFYRPWEQTMLGKAKRILVTSPPYLEWSDALKKWSSKCRVVPLGVDPQRLPPPGREPREIAEQIWGAGLFRVLAVGRLTYYKGFRHLVHAAARVPGAAVRIVGEGALRGKLQRTIAGYGMGGRVKLVGSVSDETLRALIATCHILCLPSVERTEAFGLVLLEAMRYGRAIVASDIPGSGVGWVVGKGRCGLLVKPGNDKELAQALVRLSEDPALSAELGRQGAERFGEFFHIQSVKDQIVEIYRSLTGPNRNCCPSTKR